MADNMMRMAGRGEDGLAKAIRTDNEGNLNVMVKGVNAESNAEGLALSFQLDNDGNPVLRVLDAAPKGLNTEGVAISGAGHTETKESVEFLNQEHKGVLIFLGVSGGTGPGLGENIKLQIQTRKNEIDTLWRTLYESPALTTFGARLVYFYPNVGAAQAGVFATVPYPLPYRWRIRVLHSGTGSWIYDVNYQLLG